MRHTTDSVRKYLNQFGYELLNEFKSSNIHVNVKCPIGHITEMFYTNFKKRNSRCSVCIRKSEGERKRKEQLGTVNSLLNKEGYKLISEYMGVDNNSILECPKGHQVSVRIGNFKNGMRCGICNDITGRNSIYTEEYVRNYIGKYGYKLIEYKKSYLPMTIKCIDGHISSKAKFSNFKRGVRCIKCHNEKSGIKMRHSFEFVKKTFEDRGYKLLDTEYVNSHAFLDAVCPKGHTYRTKFYNFLMVKGCRICAGKEKYSIEQVIKIASQNNFDVLDKEYKSALSKIHIKCRTCGCQSKKNFSLVKRGFGCKKCQYEKMSLSYFIRFNKNDIKFDIKKYLRTKIKRTQWFKETRLISNNKCVVTGSSKNTEAHHIINFKTILNETLKELNLEKNIFSFNELWQIKRLFFTKQEQYGHGILLSKKIHTLFHSIYGKENNTKEQLDEFIFKVKNGEINP